MALHAAFICIGELEVEGARYPLRFVEVTYQRYSLIQPIHPERCGPRKAHRTTAEDHVALHVAFICIGELEVQRA